MFLCGRYCHKKLECWYNRNNTQNSNNSGNNIENANNTLGQEELEDVSLICIENPEVNIINSIQDTTFKTCNNNLEMIETCKYYDVLNGEETGEKETNYEIEDNSMYTEYECDNYYDDE